MPEKLGGISRGGHVEIVAIKVLLTLFYRRGPIMKIGEIYFIRERDRIDGTSSPYIKIGMVNDVSRNSAERLMDHQTGNPRDLILHHVTQTPGPFRVERFLHQQFGPNRVRSEWFRLSDDELESAIQICEKLAAEALIHIPIMEKADELADVLSAPDKIQPTDDSNHWISALSVAKAAHKMCREMAAEYSEVAATLSDEDRAAVEEEELVLTEHFVTKNFDEDGFRGKYPDLFEQYSETLVSISRRFTPKTLDVKLTEVDRELIEFSATFTDACERVRLGSLAFGELFNLRQILEQFSGTYSWDEDVATAHLKVICGTAAGIEGQVTWNRTAKEVISLDTERLESDHLEKYSEFVTVKTGTRLKTRRRAKKAVAKSHKGS